MYQHHLSECFQWILEVSNHTQKMMLEIDECLLTLSRIWTHNGTCEFAHIAWRYLSIALAN